MKIEKICVEIVYFCEEFVSEMPNPCLKPTNKEIFQTFPVPVDFPLSSRNIELFIVILRAEPEISR